MHTKPLYKSATGALVLEADNPVSKGPDTHNSWDVEVEGSVLLSHLLGLGAGSLGFKA